MVTTTTYLGNKILDLISGRTAFSLPSGLWIGLFGSNPTVSGTLTSEVAVSGYARKQLTFPAASAKVMTIEEDIDFAEALAAWGVISYWGIMDASTAGNMYFFGAMTDGSGNPVNRIVQAGDIVRIPSPSIAVL